VRFEDGQLIGQLLMRSTDAESREDKFATSIVTSTTLEEVVMDEPLTLSGSKKRKNTVGEGDGPLPVKPPLGYAASCACSRGVSRRATHLYGT